MTIGILALQGDFAKHCAMVEKAGGIPLEVRTATDLSVCRGLIIPGGESTSICRQIDERGLREPLKEFGARRPVFGTCAGLIVMSRKVNKFPFKTFGWLDLTIERNAYGRQTDSFVTSVMLGMDSLNQTPYEAFFIRAPRIESVGADVQVFSMLDGEPILVRQGNYLGASFHPELSDDPLIHRYFIAMTNVA